jgi:hypothetical protein
VKQETGGEKAVIWTRAADRVRLLQGLRRRELFRVYRKNAMDCYGTVGYLPTVTSANGDAVCVSPLLPSKKAT